jgi:DNA recombination protein RmuC
MGFRTLSIEKRTSEIQNTLRAVKTEFGKFQGVLGKVRDKLRDADTELETLVGVRTRKIESKLRGFEELPESEAQALIAAASEEGEIDE